VGEGVDLLNASDILGVQLAEEQGEQQVVTDQGIVTARGADMDAFAEQFIEAIAQHRHWSREQKDMVPA
jgi:catalase